MIYGWRCFRKPHTTFYQDIVCGHCKSKGIYLYLYIRYLHIGFIPFFPLAKILQSTCQNCHHTLAFATMPEQLRALALETKKSVSYPWYAFSGLIIVALFIVYGAISGEIKRW